MGDLVVGLAKSVVEGALIKAQLAIEEEAKLQQSAQRNLVFITGELEMMHSFLSVADEERVKNSVVRTWVRQVRELAYDVEDCIEFVVHLDNKPHWWRRLLPSCVAAAALPLDEAVAEIEQLKARVEDVSKRNTRYSLISDSGSKPVMHQLQPAPSARVGATTLNMLIEARDAARRQQGLRDLTQLITKKDDDLKVISVWGTGGDLGTTSIIRKAYGDPEVCRNFGCRGWVKLTHPFNPREFLSSLVAQFYTNSCLGQGTTVDVDELKRMEETATAQGGLVEDFMKQVNEKRYLVVLENVSTMGEWDAIRTYLPDRKNGSWVIVSTQQCEIASLCIGHSYQVLELKQYSAEHSVCVFFKEGSQGDGDEAEITDRVTASNNGISTEDEGSRRGGLSSYDKKNAARDWMTNFTLVGREAQMNELRKYAAKARLKSLQVMSVWGIAGVGKSILVRNLCYDRMLHSNQFDKYGWVDVSSPFNLRDFSRSLLVNFHSESLQAKETEYRGAMGIRDPIQECRKLLKEHRCLVIIDGLQSTEEWDLIQPALVSRPSRSLIIVITTEASIAAHCADNEEVVFNVKGLEADAAFDLFKKEVHRKKQSSPLKDSKDAEILELISKCGGLPKVIVAIADFLAPKTVTWMDTASSMNPRFMHELETNPEFAILRDLFGWMHSYFRTCPDFLKPCIFYLSIFPRDHSIRRRRLVRRWIAEGYSRDTDNNSAEQNGEMFFSKLLDLSIIQQPPQLVTNASNDNRMILCQVNSFIREYIISRRMEENLVFELGSSCSLTTQRTGRHLVIQKSWDRDRIVFESIDFSRLRSLTVFGEWRQFFISDRMRLLRVLDLEDASGVTDKDLEQMMKLLSRLKFLSLRGCSEICRLPTSLGDLRQLQTLDVRHTAILTLPETITKLQKLQYIRAGTSVPAWNFASLGELLPKKKGRFFRVLGEGCKPPERMDVIGCSVSPSPCSSYQPSPRASYNASPTSSSFPSGASSPFLPHSNNMVNGVDGNPILPWLKTFSNSTTSKKYPQLPPLLIHGGSISAPVTPPLSSPTARTPRMKTDWDESTVQPPWHGSNSPCVVNSTPPSPGRSMVPDPTWLAGIQISSTNPSSPTFSLVSSNPFSVFKEAIPQGSSSRICTPGQSGTCSPVIPGMPQHPDVHMMDVVSDEFAFGSSSNGNQLAAGMVRAWEGERIHEDSGSDDLELTLGSSRTRADA